MTIFLDFLRPPAPKNSPNFSACGGLKSLGGDDPPIPPAPWKKIPRTGGRRWQNSGGIFTGGGACEIFGEEFSHFFVTNFFDLHHIMYAVADKIWHFEWNREWVRSRFFTYIYVKNNHSLSEKYFGSPLVYKIWEKTNKTKIKFKFKLT